MDPHFSKPYSNTPYGMMSSNPDYTEYQPNYSMFPDYQAQQGWSNYNPMYHGPPQQLQYPVNPEQILPGPQMHPQYFQGNPGTPGMTINVHTHFIPTPTQMTPSASNFQQNWPKQPMSPPPAYTASISCTDSENESQAILQNPASPISERSVIGSTVSSPRCESVMSSNSNDRKRGRKKIEQTEEERLAKRQLSNRESQRKSRELKKRALESLATDNTVLQRQNSALGSTISAVVSLIETEYIRRGGMDHEFSQLRDEVARLTSELNALNDRPITRSSTRRH